MSKIDIFGKAIEGESPVKVAKSLIDDILDNGADVLDVLRFMKTMETLHKQLKENDRLRYWIDAEVAKYGDNAIGRGVIVVKKSRKTYEYDDCNDPVWNKLQAELKELNKRIAERESLLKALKEPMADVETGEVIFPPVVKYTDYYTIELTDD